MIQLYGLFKQGTQDPPFEQTKAPGMFELKVRLSCPRLKRANG